MGSEKLKVDRAIIVEGRDDVAAVSRACEALIIATHGFGITKETWDVIEKAHREKGIIILTDPDHSGEEIRKKISAKFDGALQAYVDRGDATAGSDIGIENAKPEAIAEAINKALERADCPAGAKDDGKVYADMSYLTGLGLAAGEGASEKRAKVCKMLGIGYGNASGMIKKLRGFGIGLDELTEAVKKIQ